MALTKVDSLALGRGSLSDNSNAVICFTSNAPVALYSAFISYAQYNCVEYSGKVYRSKIGSNNNNQPDISPSQWEVLYSGVKDGDVSFIVAGPESTVSQRVAGSWAALGGIPVTVALTDGQIAPTDAIVFVGMTKSWAVIDYTIRRGSGQGRKRRGKFNILNDTVVSDVEYDHEFSEIGLDVDVVLSVVASGANVSVQYTSGLEATAIELKWMLSQGWT
jgi:hypothetical protein